MTSRWTHPVFSVGDTTWTWDDVAAFARRHRRWDALVGEAAEGLACERAGHVAPPPLVKEAAKVFRYERRLITAEETETWLRARDLDVAEWMRWVRHTVLRAEHPETPAGGADAKVEALIWVTGRCGGLLDELASDLAARVAAHATLTGAVPSRDDEVDDAVDHLRAAVVTDEAVGAEVGRRQLDWLGVETEEACFVTADAAREAVLCVRDDGLALAEVAKLADVPYARRRTRLAELDAALRPIVLGARLDEVVGPVPMHDGFVVVRVESKVVPAVDDPEVARRAADAVLAVALRRAVEERVRWHDRD